MIISVVNFYQSDHIEKQIQGIPDAITIAIVDNSENTEEWSALNKLSETRENIILTRSCGNVGYGAGHNQNFRIAKQKRVAILIVCPDIRFAPEFFDRFQKQHDDNLCSMFVTKNSNEKILYAHLRLKSTYETEYVTMYDETCPNSYLAGSCFFLGAGVVQNLDVLFDEDLFLYWEEYIVARKLRKLGYNLVTTNLSVTRLDNSRTISINSHKNLAKSFAILMTKFPDLRNLNGACYVIKHYFIYIILKVRNGVKP